MVELVDTGDLEDNIFISYNYRGKNIGMSVLEETQDVEVG